MNDFVKEHWKKNALMFKDSHWASWGDNYAIDLEIDNISEYIRKGMCVLDVGCANGYSTFKQYKKRKINITGVDYSEEMIYNALDVKRNLYTKGTIDFIVADIRKLPFSDKSFDLTYTTRVLINLPSWEDQIRGINECIRVTKKGGCVIFSEAFWEPLTKLNAVRHIFGLAPLVEHDFNRYLKISKLTSFLKENNYKVNYIDFSSVYYFGSRLLREIITDYNSYPGYSNPINKVFFNLEKKYSGGAVGIQMLAVISL